MWILLITFYISSSFNDAPAITSQQVIYKSHQECLAAAAFLHKKKDEGVKNPRYRITLFCIPGSK